MNEPARGGDIAAPRSRAATAQHHKRDFWAKQNLKHTPAHYRLRKAAKVIGRLATGHECDLLDVGCGPATLRTLLPEAVDYYGIDIAIHSPARNLIESDILEAPIRFDNRKFDIVTALGVFEYVGDLQEKKFAEIAEILKPGGTFLVSYTNFGHRGAHIFEAFSNIQPLADFRRSLGTFFRIERSFPASHNWYGGQPTRRPLMAVNMLVNANIAVLSARLGVEYFFLCSRPSES